MTKNDNVDVVEKLPADGDGRGSNGDGAVTGGNVTNQNIIDALQNPAAVTAFAQFLQANPDILAGGGGGGAATNQATLTYVEDTDDWNLILDENGDPVNNSAASSDGKYITKTAWRRFMKSKTGLGLDNDGIRMLRKEGLTHPTDFATFSGEEVEKVFKNFNALRTPLNAKSQRNIKRFCDFVQYCHSINRSVRDADLKGTTLESHAAAYSALLEKKDQDKSPVALIKYSENTDILTYLDRVEKALAKIIGPGKAPLAYVIRIDVEVPRNPTVGLIVGKCYSNTYGSYYEELIHRLSHLAADFDADNAMVFELFDISLQKTSHESLLNDHRKKKDGRAVYLALVERHGGQGRWEKSYDTLEAKLDKVWKSTGNIPLVSHINSFRDTVSKLNTACKHTSNEPFSQRNLVLKLIKSMDTRDVSLVNAIGKVKDDEAGAGSNFDEAAKIMIRYDPVEESQTNSKSNSKGSISAAGLDLAGRGEKTGVDLRWYPRDEFQALPDAQKDELREWRETTEGKKAFQASLNEAKKKKRKAAKGNNSNGNMTKKQKKDFNKKVNVAAANKLKQALKKQKTIQKEKAAANAQRQSEINAAFQDGYSRAAKGVPPPPPAAPAPAAVQGVAAPAPASVAGLSEEQIEVTFAEILGTIQKDSGKGKTKRNKRRGSGN